jgi:hypothetical protein
VEEVDIDATIRELAERFQICGHALGHRHFAKRIRQSLKLPSLHNPTMQGKIRTREQTNGKKILGKK